MSSASLAQEGTSESRKTISWLACATTGAHVATLDCDTNSPAESTERCSEINGAAAKGLASAEYKILGSSSSIRGRRRESQLFSMQFLNIRPRSVTARPDASVWNCIDPTRVHLAE